MTLTKRLVWVLATVVMLGACANDETVKEVAEPTTIAGIVVPSPLGTVNDFENIVSAESEEALKDSLADFKTRTGHELVVVTMDTIPQDKNPIWFATEIGNHWGVGDAEKNNGLLMVISEEMAQIGIATGVGIETIYTDSVCNDVIQKMIPYLSVGDYDGGVYKAIRQFEAVNTTRAGQ